MMRTKKGEAMKAESQRYELGEVDEVAYAKALNKAIKYYKRLRDKNYLDCANWSDKDCEEAAEMYLRTYRGQFRKLIPVD